MFNNRVKSIYLAVATIVLLGACSANSQEPVKTGSCELDPPKEPMACTMQYDPVCARRDTGVRCVKAPCPGEELKTYSNGCTACTDPAVRDWVQGACDPS